MASSLVKQTVNRIRGIEQIDQLNKSVGRKVFGNTNGAVNNVAGRARLAKARYNSDVEPDKETQDIVMALRRGGYHKLGKPYDENLIETIRSKFEEFIEDDEKSFIRSQHDGEVYSRSIKRAHQNIPELGDLLTEDIARLVRNYYGSYFTVLHLISWRNYHVPTEVIKHTEIFSDAWHCDKRTTDTFKLFVCLSHVTEEDGPLHIQSRERTRELVAKGFRRGNGAIPNEVINDEDHIVTLTGEPGTAMLCNTTQCLHRAGNPEEGRTRDIVQFQFLPSSAPLSDDWRGSVKLQPLEARMTGAD